MKTPYFKLFTLFGVAGILAGVIASSRNSGDAEDTTMSENTEPKTDQAQNEQE